MATPTAPGSLPVNFHCHSNLSDGELPPEELAERLAQAGVRHAALTDHDTLAGTARFQAVLSRHAIGCLSGVELCATSPAGDIHVLVYGMDPAGDAATALLGDARSGGGTQPFERIVSQAHAAGARVFLAHPLVITDDVAALAPKVATLKALGLDGIEAIYAPYGQDQILALLALAKEQGLATSAGTDFHGQPGLSDLAVHMPLEDWRTFRACLFSAAPHTAPIKTAAAESNRRSPPRLAARGFVLRILVPTLLALALLVVPVLTYIIPRFEDALHGRKLEMIQELTRSAVSILQEYEDEVVAGRLSAEDARRAAAKRIQFLRYGKEGKDYFWITDLQPRMIMHPYRPDLNGQDLSTFADPRGVRLFVEFARLAREKREGTLAYLWQWKDDAGRVAPKESYVRMFEPWGWVVGTGLYLDDVRAEIREITGRVVHVTLALAVVISLLLLFVAQQSFRIERRRHEAEQALRDSHERYRALVEATKEGTLLLVSGHSAFANQALRTMLGYSEQQWALVDPGEVFQPPQGSLADYATAVEANSEPDRPVEMTLSRRDGSRFTALVTPERVKVSGEAAVILVVRDLSGQKQVEAALGDIQARFRSVAENLKVAVFRFRFDESLTVVEANPAAHALLGPSLGRQGLAAILGESTASVRRVLMEKGEIRERHLRLSAQKDTVLISLSATLVRDERGAPAYGDAIAEDVTLRHERAQAKESLLAELQSSMSFLDEPVTRFMRELPAVPLHATVAEAAATMTKGGLGFLAVRSTAGETVGVVTDHDLRARVLAGGKDPSRPVFEFMSSPILAVSPNAEAHEALDLMREKGVQHLAVRDDSGQIVGVVRGRELLRVDHHPLVLVTRAIKEASRPEDVASQRGRLPPLVSSLIESGARPRHLCRSISAISDAITDKLLAFAEAALGPAPVAYAFLVLGSEGREEQTLVSDQDSAIVFDDAGGDPARAYFLALGERISAGLETAGFPVCRGGMMANNPKWCQSLGEWRRYFTSWIEVGEPKELMQFNTFFDFRRIRGETALATALRTHVRHELAGADAFLGHLAREILQYRPPLGFFGNIVAGTDEHGHKTFNAKDAMASIVNLARLYALRHDIAQTSTFDRIRRLHELGVLSPNGYEGLSQAHDFLMMLRLRHQAARLASGYAGDNDIELASLTPIELGTLKQLFSQIALMQKKAALDFLGMV